MQNQQAYVVARRDQQDFASMVVLGPAEALDAVRTFQAGGAADIDITTIDGEPVSAFELLMLLTDPRPIDLEARSDG